MLVKTDSMGKIRTMKMKHGEIKIQNPEYRTVTLNKP